MKRQRKAKKETDQKLEELEAINIGDETPEIGLNAENDQSHSEKPCDVENSEVISLGSLWAVYISKGAQQRILCFSFVALLIKLHYLYLYNYRQVKCNCSSLTENLLATQRN